MATLEQLTELGTLNQCTYECTKQSRWKETTQRYLSNMLPNNVKLQQDILNGRYEVLPTINFTLNERGKIRKIEAPVVRDRIVQKSLMKSVLIPSLRPYLIYDNYASIKMRGTTFARNRLEYMLRNYYHHNGTDGYILQVDIKKYFENIDHEVLKQLIAPRLKNEPEDVVKLIHYLIDHSSHSSKGLNLGSEAPQILAIYYLNPLDHFIKVVRGIRYYGRYMDDIFIIHRSKKYLKELLSDIVKELAKLKLNINPKKTHIVRLTHGFTFLQIKYNLLGTGKILKRPAHGKIVRERRRLKAFRRRMRTKQMTEGEIYNCYQSWRGTVVKDHNAYIKTINSLDLLYRILFPVHIEEQRKGRKEIASDIWKDAEPQDIKYCLTFN